MLFCDKRSKTKDLDEFISCPSLIASHAIEVRKLTRIPNIIFKTFNTGLEILCTNTDCGIFKAFLLFMIKALQF